MLVLMQFHAFFIKQLFCAIAVRYDLDNDDFLLFEFLQDDYLVLCPSHSSIRFPNEKKSKPKKHNIEHCNVTTQMYILFLLVLVVSSKLKKIELSQSY